VHPLLVLQRRQEDVAVEAGAGNSKEIQPRITRITRI
jgi:hypothetical protein